MEKLTRVGAPITHNLRNKDFTGQAILHPEAFKVGSEFNPQDREKIKML